MKFTHIVVKAGNGEPTKDQIDDAAMVKNAGQVFAIVATFKDDPKQGILISTEIAKDIEKHQESHHFEIHELEKPENGQPLKPGERLDESTVGDITEAVLMRLTESDNKYVRQLAVLVMDELDMDPLV